jgi:thiamine biosynthesis lipoprotein
MGTAFRLVLYAASAEQAARASQAAFARVAALDAILSDYRADSELTALGRRAGGPPVLVGPDLLRVLSASQEWARRSDGAFDATVGPAVQLWRRARRIGEMPQAPALAEARALVGYRSLLLDAPAGTARLAQAGMRLDLGGIAKGFAADEAQEVLRAHGITRALVAAGGDVVVSGPPPDRSGWSIEVALPAPLRDPDAPPLELQDAAVSTSGDAEQFVTLDGVRYSHIVDPRTGLALTGRSGVTVVAPDGTTSDALATAISVLGPSGLALVEETPGASAWIAREGPAGVERFVSIRWREQPRGVRGGARGPSQPASPSALALPPEIRRPTCSDAGSLRRPSAPWAPWRFRPFVRARHARLAVTSFGTRRGSTSCARS